MTKQSKTQKTIIFAGADIPDYEWAGNQITEGDMIICADSGARHAHAMDITPNIIIGDFDSIDPALLNFYKGQCEIIHDTDQNATDLMKALSWTSSRAKARDLETQAIYSPTPATPLVGMTNETTILGATGQRADHDFATYLILLNLDQPDHIVIKTPSDERRVIKNNFTFLAEIGDAVGVFPLLPIGKLSYEGLEFAPDALGGPYEFGWNGACNKVTAPQVTIALDSGAALVTRTYA